MSEIHYPDPAQNYPETSEFCQTFHEAMLSLLSSPDYVEVIYCFWDAYEERKRLPWLDESRNRPTEGLQNGLAYALQAAIATYIVPASFPSESILVPGTPSETLNGKTVDTDRREQLVAAVEATIAEGFSLKRFERALLRAGITRITPTILQGHIAEAFIKYYSRRMIGTSADPF